MVGPCFDHVSQASQAPIATANAGIIQITDMRRERRVVARGTAARCSRTSLITRLPSTPDGFGIITHADAECRARRWAGQPEPGFPIGQIARSWRVRLCISGKRGFLRTQSKIVSIVTGCCICSKSAAKSLPSVAISVPLRAHGGVLAKPHQPSRRLHQTAKPIMRMWQFDGYDCRDKVRPPPTESMRATSSGRQIIVIRPP